MAYTFGATSAPCALDCNDRATGGHTTCDRHLRFCTCGQAPCGTRCPSADHGVHLPNRVCIPCQGDGGDSFAVLSEAEEREAKAWSERNFPQPEGDCE